MSESQEQLFNLTDDSGKKSSEKKTVNSQELLLKLIGDEKEDTAPRFMEYALNKGMEYIPEVFQTGMKKGQTLKAHIQNVMCFCYQLADILEIEDSDKTNLIAAAYVHDLNKFPEYSGKSYSTIANKENVQQILDNMLAESEYDFDLSYDLVTTVIRGHSGHMHSDGNGLFAQKEHLSAEKLIAVIQAADIFDLSHHFHESDHKEKAFSHYQRTNQGFPV
ncbi:MAG: HD domain-containing protein [Desulfobacterales bacterium]